MPSPDPSAALDRLIALALEEDLADVGDVTSEFFVDADDTCRGRIFAKADGFLAGVDAAVRTFAAVDTALEVKAVVDDGAKLEHGTTVLEISGKTRSVLTAERTALNFLQRLSGIATVTAEYVEAVKPNDVKVLDTRKTTPGWRFLQKGAVAAGGGTNHRMGLYDQVMVKDNHLLSENNRSELAKAVEAARTAHPGIKIELEADTLAQASDFMDIEGIDIILLDNMSNDQLREAVAMNAEKGSPVVLEASGGVTLDTIADISATGVDAISVGALTHSAPSLDLSLELL